MADTNLTYTKLAQLLPSYLERPDPAFQAQIPTFINLAENRIATEMKQQGFQATVSGTLPTDGVLAKPAWWRETLSFYFTNAAGDRVPLLLRPYQYCRNYWPNATLQGVPVYYADYNATNFFIVPTPLIAYTFELLYFARLEPLTIEHQENWMTLNVPQALLYAALIEAAMWAKDTDKQVLYQSMYDSARNSIVGENLERLTDRTTIVTRP